MSAGKNAKHNKKMAAKRAAKAARHALYKSYAEHGHNSKRQKLRRARRDVIKNESHPEGKCCNVGCTKCSPMAQLMAAKQEQFRAQVKNLHELKLRGELIQVLE